MLWQGPTQVRVGLDPRWSVALADLSPSAARALSTLPRGSDDERSLRTAMRRESVPADEETAVLAHLRDAHLLVPARTPDSPDAATWGLLAADGDAAALTRLAGESAQHEDRVFRDVVSPLCAGLVSVVEERWDAASTALTSVVATMAPLGGSKAQREVVEDTLVHALAMAGRTTEAAAVLDERLSRRSSPLDARRRTAVVAGVPAGH